MVGAHQHEIVDFGGAAVFPVPDVVGVQSAGGATAGDHAAAVPVLERTTQPSVDRSVGPSGSDDLAVTFEPHFAGGVAGQEPPLFIGQQRAQMQGSHPLCDIEMGDHGGVVAVRSAGYLGVPARSDQAHESLDGVGKRGRLIVGPLTGVVIPLPLGDLRVMMRLQGSVKGGCFDTG